MARAKGYAKRERCAVHGTEPRACSGRHCLFCPATSTSDELMTRHYVRAHAHRSLFDRVFAFLLRG